MSQTQPTKRGRKSSTEEERVSGTNLLQNIQSTVMKLLEVTSNKMDKMIETINDLKEETELNRIKAAKTKAKYRLQLRKSVKTMLKSFTALRLHRTEHLKA